MALQVVVVDFLSFSSFWLNLILHLIFDHFEGGGSAEGAGLPPFEGGEGEDLLLQCHTILQSQNLKNGPSTEIQFVKVTPLNVIVHQGSTLTFFLDLHLKRFDITYKNLRNF